MSTRIAPRKKPSANTTAKYNPPAATPRAIGPSSRRFIMLCSPNKPSPRALEAPPRRTSMAECGRKNFLPAPYGSSPCVLYTAEGNFLLAEYQHESAAARHGSEDGPGHHPLPQLPPSDAGDSKASRSFTVRQVQLLSLT